MSSWRLHRSFLSRIEARFASQICSSFEVSIFANFSSVFSLVGLRIKASRSLLSRQVWRSKMRFVPILDFLKSQLATSQCNWLLAVSDLRMAHKDRWVHLSSQIFWTFYSPCILSGYLSLVSRYTEWISYKNQWNEVEREINRSQGTRTKPVTRNWSEDRK